MTGVQTCALPILASYTDDSMSHTLTTTTDGLFQFLPRTWTANSARAGYAGVSVFDAVANANTAAYMFANQQARQWACK